MRTGNGYPRVKIVRSEIQHFHGTQGTKETRVDSSENDAM